MNERRGYTVEIDDYREEDGAITFEIRVLKNGAFRASQSMQIRVSELTAESQLRSQVERFSALVENKLI